MFSTYYGELKYGVVRFAIILWNWCCILNRSEVKAENHLSKVANNEYKYLGAVFSCLYLT